MTFDDLEWTDPTEGLTMPPGWEDTSLQAFARFDNGWTVSILGGKRMINLGSKHGPVNCIYTDGDTYECATMKGGTIRDVTGFLTKEEVTALLQEVEAR